MIVRTNSPDKIKTDLMELYIRRNPKEKGRNSLDG